MRHNFIRTFNAVRMNHENQENIRSVLSSRLAEKQKEMTMSKTHSETPYWSRRTKKLSKASLVAAVLAAVLSVSALAAVGVTYWAEKQAELRSILSVDGKDIPEYVEYNLADTGSVVGSGLKAKEVEVAEATEATETIEAASEVTLNTNEAGTSSGSVLNVTVLSSMQDSQFMRYYIAVSPVTSKNAQKYSWFVKREGSIGWRLATIINQSFDEAYDESSQSLLLDFSLMIGTDIDLNESEPFMATLIGVDFDLWTSGTLEEMHEIMPEFCSRADFTIVPVISEIAAVSITFGDGVEFINPSTGEKGLIHGVEINSGSIAWISSYDTAEKHFTSDDSERSKYIFERADWTRAFENTIRDAVLNMSDGSTRGMLIPNQADYKDGLLKENAFLIPPIELSSLESITVNGITYQID